jgi:hypothetical protein
MAPERAAATRERKPDRSDFPFSRTFFHISALGRIAVPDAGAAGLPKPDWGYKSLKKSDDKIPHAFKRMFTCMPHSSSATS